MSDASGLRAGSETGSLMNHIMSRQGKEMVEESVKVGDGCTILSWSDRHAATVVAISGNKRKVITIREDKATRTDSNGYFTESQSYAYEEDPHGRVHEVSYRKGAWRIRGEDRAVAFGYRRSYRDPSF